MRKMKRALAVAMSTVMMVGTSMTAFAADQEVSVDAPIYAYDITNVVVPTNFSVAFNPSGLDVNKGGAAPVQDQIVSKNYGIINKSTQDKVITVTLKVEDLNEDKITFAENASDVTSASAGDYVINLTVVPADDQDEVKVGTTPASANLDTTGADLANATMSPSSTVKTLVAGENDVDFLLEKAVYTGSVDLDTANGNNVADAFTINSLAASGKGITAFTFGGTMNGNADWTKLTKGIRITAVYSNENAPSGANTNIASGTGALYDNPNPVFKAGADIGTIKYRPGTDASAKLASITKVEMDFQGNLFDGYHELAGNWEAASDVNGVITLPAKYIANYQKVYPNDETREAIITYETIGGTTETATVKVKLKEPVVTSPSFTTGSAVGTISYESGAGSEALASITKVEMDFNGNLFDGYHELKDNWAAATDVNGVITLPTEYISNYATSYPSDATREATITYVTVGGETKTATVNVKIR